jgi:hypothetical protein
VVFTLINDGDHRLSRPEDIDLLLSAVGEFYVSENVSGAVACVPVPLS